MVSSSAGVYCKRLALPASAQPSMPRKQATELVQWRVIGVSHGWGQVTQWRCVQEACNGQALLDQWMSRAEGGKAAWRASYIGLMPIGRECFLAPPATATARMTTTKGCGNRFCDARFWVIMSVPYRRPKHRTGLATVDNCGLQRLTPSGFTAGLDWTGLTCQARPALTLLRLPKLNC